MCNWIFVLLHIYTITGTYDIFLIMNDRIRYNETFKKIICFNIILYFILILTVFFMAFRFEAEYEDLATDLVS